MLDYKIEEYIRTLNPLGANETWMPIITAQRLASIKASGNMIAIGNDWFSQGSYCTRFMCILNDELIELKEHPLCFIANKDEDFIFESGSLDHKGLIAIEVPKGVDFCHVQAGRDENGNWREVIKFLSNSNLDFKKKITSIYLMNDNDIFIKKAEYLITADDYQHIVDNFNCHMI